MAAASASLPLPARSKRTAEPSADPAPDLFFVDSEGAWAETPLTSEPPLADAEPLTSEPPLADTAPLTSESATMDAPLTSEAGPIDDPMTTSGEFAALVDPFAAPDSTRP
ncbi:hypothetical protein [Streptomyces xylophagus]|uniref:hypothetical protein n=1 Tax=Streptomyces xylophagus TaxID=285514 RepID=UPI000B0EB2DD|nr:hypothetical protein [Streptomyces xylophagus]